MMDEQATAEISFRSDNVATVCPEILQALAAVNHGPAASYGDDGITYHYSGTENKALPWTPTLLEIKKKIEAVKGEYNYCLLNRYRSGADSVVLHHGQRISNLSQR